MSTENVSIWLVETLCGLYSGNISDTGHYKEGYYTFYVLTYVIILTFYFQ